MFYRVYFKLKLKTTLKLPCANIMSNMLQHESDMGHFPIPSSHLLFIASCHLLLCCPKKANKVTMPTLDSIAENTGQKHNMSYNAFVGQYEYIFSLAISL